MAKHRRYPRRVPPAPSLKQEIETLWEKLVLSRERNQWEIQEYKALYFNTPAPGAPEIEFSAVGKLEMNQVTAQRWIDEMRKL